MTFPEQQPSAKGDAEAALEHLQQAAMEMIAAARSGLDLLQDLVSAPGGLGAVIGLVGQLAEAVAGAAVAGPTKPHAEEAPVTPDRTRQDATVPGAGPRVQHIPVTPGRDH